MAAAAATGAGTGGRCRSSPGAGPNLLPSQDLALQRRLRAQPRPIIPRPSTANVAGSGMGTWSCTKLLLNEMKLTGDVMVSVSTTCSVVTPGRSVATVRPVVVRVCPVLNVSVSEPAPAL